MGWLTKVRSRLSSRSRGSSQASSPRLAGEPSLSQPAPAKKPVRVLAKRMRKKDQEWEYLVEWTGGHPNSWVEREELGSAHVELVAEFNQKEPGAARPLPSLAPSD